MISFARIDDTSLGNKWPPNSRWHPVVARMIADQERRKAYATDDPMEKNHHHELANTILDKLGVYNLLRGSMLGR